MLSAVDENIVKELEGMGFSHNKAVCARGQGMGLMGKIEHHT